MKDDKENRKLGDDELEIVSGGVQNGDQYSNSSFEEFIECSDDGNTDGKSPLY